MKGYFSFTQNGDAAGDAFEVGGDVRGEEDRAFRLVDDFEQGAQEFSPGVRVETGDRLVEDQQVGLVAEGQDDAERLELADRERTDAIFERQLPAAAQFVDERGVPGWIECCGVGDHLSDAHPRVADDFLRNVTEAGLGVGREIPGVVAAEGGGAVGGAQQAECAFDERRFAAAVLAEQAEDGARRDFEINAPEDFFAVEVFFELVDFDHDVFVGGGELGIHFEEHQFFCPRMFADRGRFLLRSTCPSIAWLTIDTFALISNPR